MSAIGTRGPQSICQNCGRGSGRCGHQDPGICRGRRLTFRFSRRLRLRTCGARAVPAESAPPALHLRGSNKRQDPPDLAGGVPGAHQGGRPGGALPVSLGRRGSLPQILLSFHKHATCLRSPVHIRTRGSVFQYPAQLHFPRRGHVLLDR